MTMTVKTATAWIDADSDDQFTAKGQSSINGVKTGAYFGAIIPTVPTVETAFNAWLVARAEAVNGGKIEILNKNIKRVELGAMFRLWATFITTTSNGDM